MKTIRQSYTIHASVSDVWKALVDPSYIEGWEGGPVVMDEKEGTQFKLWGGDIHGKNSKVIYEKQLIQEWYGGDWDEPSIVTFTLHKEKDSTRIDLLHEKVPDEAAKDIDQGWKSYYLGPMKEYLEKNRIQLYE